MKKKIVCIFVLTLFITTAVIPVVGDIEYYNNTVIKENDIQGEYNIISDEITGNSKLVSSTLINQFPPDNVGQSSTVTIKIAVIFMKFKDIDTFAKGTIEEGYLPLLDKLNDYFVKCSYNQVDILFHTYGPYQFDYDHFHYYPTWAFSKTPFPYWTLDGISIENEAYSKAASDIAAKVGNKNYYDLAGIVINDPAFNGGLALDGSPGLSIVNDHRSDDEWWGVFAHESGHNLGLPHPTGGGESWGSELMFKEQYKFPFCVMSQMPPCEFNSWCRIKMGWLPSEASGSPQYYKEISWDKADTVHLTPLAASSIPGIKAIKIPITENSYYLVENRNYDYGYDYNLQEMGFWEGCPYPTQEGILIYRCDDSGYFGSSTPGYIKYVADSTPLDPPDIWDSTYWYTRIFEPWTDATYNPSTSRAFVDDDDIFEDEDITLFIQAIEVHDDGSIDVGIVTGDDPKIPDTAINKWNPPPYDSEDIWVDNEFKNDFGEYEHNDGDVHNPTLNGDDPWVDHDNIIQARIHNIAPTGGGTAEIGVGEVKFYVCDLSVSSSENPEFDLLGENKEAITLGPGESETVNCSNMWKPKGDSTNPDGKIKAHMCIKVVIAPQANEPNGNQIAQENIDWYNVGASPPSGSLSTPTLSQTIEVNNPSLVEDIFVHMEAIDPPEKWTVLFDKEYFNLDSGQKETVLVTIKPPVFPPLPLGTVEMINIRGTAVSQGIPGDCIITPLGGVTMMVKTTTPSSFQINLEPSSGPQGETFEINGYLEPEISTRIMIDFIKPDGTIFTEKTNTYSNGRFSHRFTPYTPGDWKVRALWGGDDTHSPAISDEISFNVEEVIIIDGIKPGFGRVRVNVENNGEEDIENVPWSINLQGGTILLGRNTSGTNVSFPAGETTTLQSEFIIGFGRPTIIVNVAGEIKEVSCRLFLFFIFGLE